MEQINKSSIKHKNKLLQDIADGLEKFGDYKLHHLKVTFYVTEADEESKRDSYEFGVSKALDVLVNDLYWDERGNWSHADLAVVDSF